MSGERSARILVSTTSLTRRCRQCGWVVRPREEIAELTPRWEKRGYDLGVGARIALGHATCGEVGFDGRSDYAAIRGVANLASRLADEATAGQILIAQPLYAEVEDVVEVEPVGELTLKGLRRPVAAFNVVAVRESAAELSLL